MNKIILRQPERTPAKMNTQAANHSGKKDYVNMTQLMRWACMSENSKFSFSKITKIKARSKIMTKIMRLGDDGKVTKDGSQCWMSYGRCEKRRTTPRYFIEEELPRLCQSQAILLGVSEFEWAGKFYIRYRILLHGWKHEPVNRRLARLVRWSDNE